VPWARDGKQSPTCYGMDQPCLRILNQDGARDTIASKRCMWSNLEASPSLRVHAQRQVHTCSHACARAHGHDTRARLRSRAHTGTYVHLHTRTCARAPLRSYYPFLRTGTHVHTRKCAWHRHKRARAPQETRTLTHSSSPSPMRPGIFWYL